jgi:hypothetical protein
MVQLCSRFRFTSFSALAAVCVAGIRLYPVFAQETKAAPGTKPAASTPASTIVSLPATPKNTTGDRRFESSIAAVDNTANPTHITLRDGTLTLELKPTTELVQEERGLVASDLKIADTLSLIALKGRRSKFSIKEKATVASINPLTLRIGDMATLTVLEPDRWEFERYTPIQPKSLTVGQTVSILINLQRDGEITTRRIAVVAKSKPVKSRNSRRKNQTRTVPSPAMPAPADGDVK